MKNNRQHERSPIEMAASYGIPDNDVESFKSATVKNISAGGFCFSSTQKANPGDQLQMAIDLDDGGQIVINVKVAWVKKNEKGGDYLLGVQIIEAPGDNLDKFMKFYSDQFRN